MKYFRYITWFFVLVLGGLSSAAQERIPLNSHYAFEAVSVEGYTYSWWFMDAENQRTDFTSTGHKTEDYFWQKPGMYQVFVQAVDSLGCQTDAISKYFEVYEGEEAFTVDAGEDTLVGSCRSLHLAAVTSWPGEISYTWSPSEGLDDPHRSDPVFTPGISTLYKVSAMNDAGIVAEDSVWVEVADLVADAGEDRIMRPGEEILLDGSASLGYGLNFLWTTTNGRIESGEHSPTPLVSGFGTYYLELTDSFGCVAADSVNVDLLSLAPIVQDDYDTTSYNTEVEIAVLANDVDPDMGLDSSSLKIVTTPMYGEAYVNYDSYTIKYIPERGFSGNDLFAYEICNKSAVCSQANVFVFVTDYEFIIPDAFSPNGDNINDYFEIVGIGNYPGNSISILNRWGNKVFEAKNYGISSTPIFWDGKSNTGFTLGDKELPTGTYYFVLKLGNGQKTIAGSIYLDR